MEIIANGNTATIVLNSRVDSTNYLRFQELVNEVDDACEKLILEFKDVTYISSAGLRVLMSAKKKMGDKVCKIVNVSEPVNEILVATGLNTFVDIELEEDGVSTYIHHSFKEILKMKSKKTPDIFILSQRGINYSWEEIEQCAQIIANDLFKLGVRKGTHVGICSSNSANWIISFFAVQKLGAIACLLNFNYTQKEIADVSEVGDITHLCFGEIAAMKDMESFITNIKAFPNNKITEFYDINSDINYKERLDEFEDVDGLFDTKVEFDDACVMIYTSGSTGKPKGVLLSAFNILSASALMANEIKIDNTDKICLILPLFHIFGMTAGLFCNALKNAEIVLPDNMRTRTILSTIQNEACTLFHSVPTMVLALMKNEAFDASKIKQLRCTILAGASATESQLLKMDKTFVNTHIVCAYGLSEMAPVSMTGYDDPIEMVIKTVGKPVENIRIAIKNQQTGEICKNGETGEIIVEGFNLMSCYYKAALEAQAIDHGGWLHTGDLGFMDEEGYLHLTGRAKELIIRGGENIMPNAVAEVISQFPDVEDVKVQGVPDDFFGEVVGASIVMKAGKELDTEALLHFLEERIAKFKIPAFVFQYDAFPVLANGKIDAVSLKKDMNQKAALLKNKGM